MRTCLILVLALCLGACQKTEKEDRPNILVIFTDDQTFGAIGYNNPELQTPNLDRLAGEGIIFQNNYTASPVCMASRAAMMTGLFPQQNGCVALDHHPFVEKYCRDSTGLTLPRILNAAGYRTLFAGKSHLGPPEDYGFREGKIFQDPRDSTTFAYVRELFEKQDPGDKPFFLWLAPRQPHVPLIPGEEWLALYDTTEITTAENFREKPLPHSMFNQGLPGELFFRDSDYTHNWKQLPAGPPRSREVIREYTMAYYATISHLDRQIGDLVESMENKGILDNTMIIFLSDNGYFLGNHGLGNKITMHEESVHVPLFIRWPGLAKQGIRCGELVSSLDLFPTILEAAGVNPPEGIPGVSLFPLFKDPGTAIHDYVASECVGVGGTTGQGHRMVRTKEWKYILTGTSEEVLYNELKDPGELHNLIEKEPGQAHSMRRHMAEWMELTGDSHAIPQ